MRSNASKTYFWFSLCFTVFVFFAASQSRVTRALVHMDENKFSGVRLTVVSQRQRPEERPTDGRPQERDYHEVIRNDLLVRFRLTNNGDSRIYYLAGLNTIEPAAYQLFRDVEEQGWKATSPARGRPGSFTGGGYEWLMLPPGTAVEFEALDLSTRGKEHSLAIFINLQPSHENRTEFLSDIYRTTKPSIALLLQHQLQINEPARVGHVSK
jgi:hypothetical protein